MKIGIIADDLTGACDSVAPFVRQGLRCGVVTALSDLGRKNDSIYDAIAITTETRDANELASDQISRTVAGAVRWLHDTFHPDIVFKKIDSTLRGHLSIELSAALSELPDRIALICPAFPANGRTVVNGELIVHPAPLEHGAERASNFVSSAFGYSQNCGWIYIDTIRSGAASVAETIQAMERSGDRCIFFAAQTDEDLSVVASIVVAEPNKYVPVGSAGFSRAIAYLLEPTVSSSGEMECALSAARCMPMLVLVGSQNPVSRVQADMLEQAAEIARAPSLGEALRHLSAGNHIALAVTPSAQQEGACTPQNLLGMADSSAFAGVTIVATGGATAMAVLRLIGGAVPPVLDVLGELEPGIVLCRIASQDAIEPTDAPIYFILKAGGFGDQHTLVRCANLIPNTQHPASKRS